VHLLSSAEVQAVMETMREVVVLGTGLVQILPRAHGQGEMKPGSAAAAVGLRRAICSTFPAAAAGAVAATLIEQNASQYRCYGISLKCNNTVCMHIDQYRKYQNSFFYYLNENVLGSLNKNFPSIVMLKVNGFWLPNPPHTGITKYEEHKS
jgi:hypothetical protein